ncbi:MAG: RnfABCDGE type electron transport complex subunit B [Candidatus Omnitrophica bacterium]|nr:RnfABCDGE type electron transport complex subunit B [Candidatus Omnitrophota bacterium]
MANTVITSILSMAGLGLFFASVLAFMNQKLKVEEDPRVEKIAGVLPGVNCGACAFTNCHLYAEALIKGKAQPDQCRAGGEQVASAISEILGVKVKKRIKEIATVHCGADASKRKKKATYLGIKTCVAAHNIFGGEILCEYGCLGYGDCREACPFGAVKLVDGLPEIDKDKCTACAKCVVVCPRNIISLQKMESKDFLYITCNNPSKGAETRKVCPVGCIACGICQKVTDGIFYVENNLAHVRSERIKEIVNPQEVVGKCPTKCIAKL